MSTQARASHPMYGLLPTDVEGFDSLAELALDMRWSWNHATDDVWRKLDPDLWEITHNPWVVLQTVSRDKIERAWADPVFRKQVDGLVRTRRDAVAARSWFQQNHPATALTCVAYFSMEFMLSEALPIYSGGLGNVAGDQLKAASDLGVPVVGVGLLYQQGYFRQVIDKDGAQQALFPYNDPGQLPITPVRQANGEWLRLEIALPGYSVWLRAWQVQVGRVKLYLLDSNDRGEHPGASRDHQRAVRRRPGAAPQAGAAARDRRMAPAPRARDPAGGLSPERRARGLRRAWSARAASCRRPGSRSRSRWPSPERGTCSRRTRRWPPASTASRRPSSSNTSAATPSRSSASRSAICWPSAARTQTTRRRRSTWPTWPSAAAGRSMASAACTEQVSRQLFEPLFPHWPEDEVPVGHVTNGVHMPTWDSAAADDLWTEACGKDRWLGTADHARAGHSPRPRRQALAVPHRRPHGARRVRPRTSVPATGRRRRLAGGGREAQSTSSIPDALTLGFARRFATYKRPNLLLHDPERLLRLLSNPERPVQLVIAGKAHPEDRAGQALIQRMDPLHPPARGATPRRLPERLRHAVDRAPRAGRRRLDQHAAAPLGGERHERHEGARQRRPESLGAGRLVGGGLRARSRLGAGRRPRARRRSRLGRRRSRRALRPARARGHPGVLCPRRQRHLRRVGQADAGEHGAAHAALLDQPQRARIHRATLSPGRLRLPSARRRQRRGGREHRRVGSGLSERSGPRCALAK